MSVLEGKLVCINNKYVILNDKRHILETPFFFTLFPNDIVEYNIDIENKINILKVKSRETKAIMGIIKNIEHGFVSLFCPTLPKFISPKIPYNRSYEIDSVLILKVTINNIEPVYFYDSITNRKNDAKIILDLYELNAEYTKIKPEYDLCEKSNYTCEFKNLNHLYTFNVDPPQSRDFDDAISIDNENNKIYIHIVDAHEQINILSYDDIHAFKHSFTLYLPECIRNILSNSMAEDKLSLIKDVSRKTITIEFDINPITCEIIKYDIYKSTIIIKERYNYDEFSKIYNNYPLLVKFYNRWKKTTLNVPHIKLNINPDNCSIINIEFTKNSDIAHKIIETLMILTNLTISKHVNVPQRFHSKVKDELTIQNYCDNEMINSILTIKKYKPAVYDSINTGHFGLGLTTYTHFTSPIRRYFDVIIHRLLAGIKYNNLEKVLEHINQREIYIENLVKLYEKIKIMDYLERNSNKNWEAYVVNITDKGVAVLLKDLLFEIFIFDNTPLRKSGDKINIEVKKIDWLSLSVKALICK